MTAATGHSVKGVSEEDMDVLLAIHTRKLRADREAKKDASELEKKHNADAKADGFNTKEISDYLDVMLSDDQQKHVDRFNMMRRNREKLGVIPEQGNTLFDDRVTREQQIENDAYQAGLNDLERKPRHTRGGSEDTLWYAAYDRGRDKYKNRWEIVLAAMQAANATAPNEEPPAKPGNPFTGKSPTLQ